MPRTSNPQGRNPAKRITLDEAVAWLHSQADPKIRDGMQRFGLPNDKALGISVGVIQTYARKVIGRDHALAEALWDTDIYEARLLASMIGDPEKLTPKSMDRWCAGFDNWGIVDTVCFKLFDQTPHGWGRVIPWTKKKGEFQRRAGYVMMACLAAHNADANARTLRPFLALIEKGATDERNFVMKGVSWALRMIYHCEPKLRAECVTLANRLAKSEKARARWIGRDALRQFKK
ncbi:DNA alkylation repair protein [Oleiharenicola lentus]|uniref:DNA alkylation repair protein n=1 Tax=Oleiharenicola lentus TaxID=2508720 RepID=UPI003F670EC5